MRPRSSKEYPRQHPVILGLFSGAGGRFILYRPGQAAARSAVGAGRLSAAEIRRPQHDGAGRGGGALSGQSRRSVLARPDARLSQPDEVGARRRSTATPMPQEWRDNNRIILENNIAFMDECLAKGVIPFAALKAFAEKQAPYLKRNVAWAAQTQVAHWMTVIGDWKKMLGSDWDKTYAASNTIYVARQNNVLFSVLAQFFGPDAINDRLMLIETISFTTTPDGHAGLAHPHHRRSLGRRAVLRQLPSDGLRTDGRRRARRDHRGETPSGAWRRSCRRPVPFGSKQWPTLVTPGPGPGVDCRSALEHDPASRNRFPERSCSSEKSDRRQDGDMRRPPTKRDGKWEFLDASLSSWQRQAASR